MKLNTVYRALDQENASVMGIEMLKNLYNCNYNNKMMQGYMFHAGKRSYKFLFSHNYRVWSVCRFLKKMLSYYEL